MDRITLKSAYEKGRMLLKNAGYSATASLDARVLLLHAAGVSTEFFYTHGDDHCLTDDQYEKFLDLLRLRLSRMPIAYVVGKKEFMGITFGVNSSVLIPRPSTETLVERALLYLKSLDKPEPMALDVGAGSGCVGLSLLFYHPGVRVFASEISPKALQTAGENCRRLEDRFPDRRIALRYNPEEGDLYERVPRHLYGRFDLIVSNPPYVTELEWNGLMDGVRLYEPYEALVSAEGPESLYSRIAVQGMELLGEKGALMLEIGSGQREMAEGILKEAGFVGIELLKDAEGFDRVLAAFVP